MVQLEESQKFKQIIQSKNEENHSLQGTISQLRSERLSLSSELDVQRVRQMFDTKNQQSQHEVELLHLRNENAMAKRHRKTLEDRLEYTISENREKDRFVREYILERGTSPEETQSVLWFFGHYEQMIQQLRPARQSSGVCYAGDQQG